MTAPSPSPFLDSVDTVLQHAGRVQGMSQIMPPELLKALEALREQRAELKGLTKVQFYTIDAVQRWDWMFCLGSLRQASRQLKQAQGTEQEPSWLRPAIQLAEQHAKAQDPVPTDGQPVRGNDPYVVLYSPEKMEAGDGAGFYSRELGWVRLEDATRMHPQVMAFKSLDSDLASTGVDDAQFLAPDKAVEIEEQYLENTGGLLVGGPR